MEYSEKIVDVKKLIEFVKFANNIFVEPPVNGKVVYRSLETGKIITEKEVREKLLAVFYGKNPFDMSY